MHRFIFTFVIPYRNRTGRTLDSVHRLICRAHFADVGFEQIHKIIE